MVVLGPCQDKPLARVILHLSEPFAQLLGSKDVYEDEFLDALTEKGLICSVSREGPPKPSPAKVGGGASSTPAWKHPLSKLYC